MKKLLTILSFLLLGATVQYAQDCTQADYTFINQNEIVEFGMNYPDCKEISGSLTISGEDIVNLDGLRQIKSVGLGLRIINTSLINLDGLDSLEYVGNRVEIGSNELLTEVLALKNQKSIGNVITIRDNASLLSLDGLQNIDLSSPLANVLIVNCPNLTYCEIENLCQHLATYGGYLIQNNGEGCNDREEMIEACSIPLDTIDRNVCYYDGFESWTDFNLPDNWTGVVETYQDVLNLEQVPALVEGDNAVALRSNIPFFEGNLDTQMWLDLEGENRLIDISFTYQCLGEGRCQINLGQASSGSEGVNRRNIWNVLAGDTTQHTILLQNIEVDPPFDFFELVELQASPIWTAVGSFGISEFIIDDFTITKVETTSSNQLTKHEHIKVYPNPATSQLFIEGGSDYSQVSIVNNLGQWVDVVPFDNQIDIGDLSPGIYFLVFSVKGKNAFQRFVKN